MKERKNTKKRIQNKEDKMSALDMIQILLDLIVATGILILCIYIYQAGSQKIKETFIKTLAGHTGGKTEENTVSGDSVSSNTVEGNESENKAVNPDFVPGKNFAELTVVNPDIKAWIEVPGTQINYPVLYSETKDGNEEYYLKRNYKKEKDAHGSIFVQTGDSYDLSDHVMIIYGHNMKDGSMFGTVHKMATSITAVRPPYLILYYPDKTVRAELLACYTTDTQLLGEKFNGFRSAQDRINYIYTFENKMPLCDVKEKDIVNGKAKIITLSTCTGGGGQRELAQFVVTEVEE